MENTDSEEEKQKQQNRIGNKEEAVRIWKPRKGRRKGKCAKESRKRRENGN